MRILGDNNVEGMVAYKEAYEIPAFVVMDWIDGPNLEQAIQGKHISDWYGILQIASDIARIVRSGHALPERVLHRLAGDDSRRKILLSVNCGDTGVMARNVTKWISPACEAVLDMMKADGWEIESSDTRWASIRILAHKDALVAASSLDHSFG